MSDSVSAMDDVPMDMLNENALMDIEAVDEQASEYSTSVVLDSRRRLKRCLEDRQLEKDLRDFDFDI